MDTLGEGTVAQYPSHRLMWEQDVKDIEISCRNIPSAGTGPVTAVPFALDRTCKTSQSDQLATGLRDAIRIGYYRTGTALPSKETLASCLEGQCVWFDDFKVCRQDDSASR
jgi:hypothetical protein